MRIFQVEDNPKEMQRLESRLKDLDDFLEKYVGVYDYESAIRVLKEYDFDIYIVDGDFPYRFESGKENYPEFLCIDLCRKIREFKTSPNIIVYSGYGEANRNRNRNRVREFDPNIPFFSKSELDLMIDYIKRFKHKLIIPRN